MYGSSKRSSIKGCERGSLNSLCVKMISLAQLVCVLLSLAAVGLATDSPVKRAVSGNQLECTRIFVESLVGNDEEA